MKKRALSLFLALALCLGLLPLTALAAELPKLPAPTDLTWGVYYEYDYDSGQGDDWVLKQFSVPGCASWTMERHAGKAAICYYNTENEKEPVAETTWELIEEDGLEMSDMTFLADAGDVSGTYYFTVQLLGDGITYGDSDIARSQTWTYTRPSAKLPAPTAAPVFTPRYDWENHPDQVAALGWDAPDDLSTRGYMVEYYFSPTDPNATNTSELIYAGGGYSVFDIGQNVLILPQVFPQPGYYYARLRYLSRDITREQNSDWSPLSKSFYYNGEGGTAELPETEDKETYTVTVSDPQHGTVTANPTSGQKGTKVTLTITPDAWYTLDTLAVTQADGTEVAVTDNTFTMPASDVTVTATFKPITPPGGKSGTMVEPTGRSLGWAVTGTGEISIIDTLPQGEAVLAACYDQDGRFVGLRQLDAQHSSAQMDPAADLRLFWLGTQLTPLAPKTTVWEE